MTEFTDIEIKPDGSVSVQGLMDRVMRQEAELAALRARVAELTEALQALYDADWMVTHDWGGDREAVLEQARAALAGREE